MIINDNFLLTSIIINYNIYVFNKYIYFIKKNPTYYNKSLDVTNIQFYIYLSIMISNLSILLKCISIILNEIYISDNKLFSIFEIFTIINLISQLYIS